MNIQQSYREATVQGASPVQLVIRLYEQMIEDLRQAAIAVEQKDIQRRTRHINHAILVIGHLQSPLDFDNGGKVARDLDHFYNVLRQNLLQVQFYPSKRGLTQLITDLLAVRSAWIEVERVERSSVTTAPVGTTVTTAPRLFHPSDDNPDSDSDRVRVDWQG
ncbi:MAG: flagellar export chaperone FliS [Terriglobales bacterium]|jgi:flagellar protein FliS